MFNNCFKIISINCIDAANSRGPFLLIEALNLFCLESLLEKFFFRKLMLLIHNHYLFWHFLHLLPFSLTILKEINMISISFEAGDIVCVEGDSWSLYRNISYS